MSRPLGELKQTVTVRLPLADAVKLREEANATKQSLSVIIEKALLAYARTSPAWRIQELKAGLAASAAELRKLGIDQAAINVWVEE